MSQSAKRWIYLIIGLIFIGAAATTLLSHLPQKERKAKYIFLFVADGLSHTHVSMTESYMSYKAGKTGGERLAFSSLPYSGNVETYSVDSPVTCSAAAGTAIATGVRTRSRFVGRGPDGEPVRSFTFDLKERGYRIGIISNAPINHATPACFYSSPVDRDDFYKITTDIPKSGFEFFASVGFKEFNSRVEGEPDTETYLNSQGYTILWGRDEFAQRDSDIEKLIICNKDNKGRDAMDYMADGTIDAEDFTLPEMVSAGVEFLSDKEPFFIMCEAGTIDWAAHINKTLPTIKLIQEMDEAVKVALEFYRSHPDETLIIVTSDHETGGASIGYGDVWKKDQPIWRILDSAWTAAGEKNVLNSEDNRKLNEAAHIGWTTNYHTGGDVPVYAIGKGAERFCGKMNNTDFKNKILAE